MSFDVYIAFKNTVQSGGLTLDRAIAERIREKLRNEGLNVFLGGKDTDDATFMEQVYGALQDAQMLILVGTSPENITCKDVSDEWRYFLDTVNSGAKPGSRIITVLSGMTSADLPAGLSDKRSFSDSDIDEISEYVFNSLGRVSRSEARERMKTEEKLKDAEEAAQREMQQRMEAERRAEEERILREQRERERIVQDQQYAGTEAASVADVYAAIRSEKRNKVRLALSVALAASILALIVAIGDLVIKNGTYQRAVDNINQGEYSQAYEDLEDLDGFRDSERLYVESVYNNAFALFEDGDYQKAVEEFERVPSLLESIGSADEFADYESKFNEAKYLYAAELSDKGEYIKARRVLKDLGSYRDSEDLYIETGYSLAEKYCAEGSWGYAAGVFDQLGDYLDSEERAVECWYKAGQEFIDSGNYTSARNMFEKCGDDKNCESYFALCDYLAEKESYADHCEYDKIMELRELFDKLHSYSDVNPDCKQACADSMFTPMKLFNALYSNGSFKVRIYKSEQEEFNLMMNYRLWVLPDMQYWIFYENEGYGSFSYADKDGVEHEWFSIVDFEDPYSAEPASMTVKDAQSGAESKLARM